MGRDMYGNKGQLLLILLRGYPGTGKSHTAQLLGESLGIPVISRDKLKTVLRKKLRSSANLGQQSYKFMWQIAENYLSKGLGCICDTSLLQPDGLPDIELLKHKYNARVVIVECFCSNRDTQLERIRKRSLYPSYYCINSVERLLQFELANKQYDSVALPYTIIKVNTAKNISVNQLRFAIANGEQETNQSSPVDT